MMLSIYNKVSRPTVHLVCWAHSKVKPKDYLSALSYRGEACQHLDLDLVGLEVKGHFRIRKVLW